MNIYIAKDYDGTPISVLLADDAEKAAIAFMGMGETPHSVEEIDPSEDCGLHGVCFLLTSHEKSSHDYDNRIGGFKFREWKRGL